MIFSRLIYIASINKHSRNIIVFYIVYTYLEKRYLKYNLQLFPEERWESMQVYFKTITIRNVILLTSISIRVEIFQQGCPSVTRVIFVLCFKLFNEQP